MLSVAPPYHLKVLDFFKQQPQTGGFFATAGRKEEETFSKIEGLKNTNKLHPDTDPSIYEKITMAWELARVSLYSLLDGELEVADRIIKDIVDTTNSARPLVAGNVRPAVTPWQETARLFRLYTDLYCDQAASTALGDTAPVIRAINLFHPGNSIRIEALQYWQEKKDQAEITRLIEGLPELDRLDIFAQKELAALTRDFLQAYLRPEWFRSTAVTSLALEYFPDLSWNEPTLPGEQTTEQLSSRIAPAHPSIKEYFAYILLDFALADPSRPELPAGRAFHFAEEMQLSAIYDTIAQKEWQFSDKKWPSWKQQALAAYAATKEI